MNSPPTSSPSDAITRRGWSRIVIGGLVAIAFAASAKADRVYDPEVVKAGVVAQIARFVEWPTQVGGPHPAVLDVVFLGDSRVADALRGRGERGLRVRVVTRAEDIGSAHVVFVTRAQDRSLPEVIGAIGARPILVIGDGAAAASRGAAFGLRDDGARVRIEVNRASLDRARLRVSYHVLRLSTEVRP